jgi:23S rRNA pseudouridine1911/1915/1917 synthase
MWEGGGVSKRELEVSSEDAGRRVDVVLARRVPGLSRARAKRLFEDGEVRVNGKRAKKGDRVEQGDWIEIDPLPSRTDFDATADPAVEVSVVLEAPHYVVVDKPPGLPSHPLRADEIATVAGALVARYPEMRGVGYRRREPGIVHRLDNDTSGLMLAARDQSTFEALVAQLRAGRIEKRYVACCVGDVEASRVIDTPIAHDPSDRKKMVAVADARAVKRLRARPAFTEILRAEPIEGGSRIEVRANHARRHQVRAHLASIGHPLLGDTLYGGPRPTGDRGHLLHASHLSFDEPLTGRRITVESPGDPFA